MGVAAPVGVVQTYYVAYPIGLFTSFVVYYAACRLSPPALTCPMSEWMEPKDYIRPEERGMVIEGRVGDVESESGVSEEKGGYEKGVKVTSL